MSGLATATVTPLPGGTARRSFRIRASDIDAVLRLPRPGLAQPLAAEAAAVRAAAAVQAGPQLLAESTAGLLIAHQRGRTLTATDLNDAQLRQRLCAALHRLHAATAPATRLDLPGWTRAYRRDLARSGIPEPAGYARLLVELSPLERALAATATPEVAAHGDAVADNFIDDGERVHVIDLEYAVRAEPWFDLATLLDDAGWSSSTSDLAADLATAYSAVSPPSRRLEALVARVRAWRLLARAAWLAWAMLPAQLPNPRAERWRDWPALRELVARESPGLVAELGG
jgi:thiamine kinase-like enzyme